jgi:serine protease Do
MINRLALTILLLSLAPVNLAAAPDWNAILTSGRSKVPPPQEKVIWRSDLKASLLEAQSTGRPMFVTLRCLPCKQCSAFDKDVLEGGADLDPLLKQYITVRLTDANAADLRLLPVEGFQDLDLSWWGYFLSPQGEVYGIFGGRDEVSDETRISKAALVNSLKRVLDHHYAPERKDWHIDGPAPVLVGEPLTASQLPGYTAWHKRGGPEVQAAACIHCHQVAEILRQPAVDMKTFNKATDFDNWPLPENVGIVLDRDDGLRVTDIRPDTPAAKSGMQPGDRLGAAGGRRLFGQADFRGVLHRGPKSAGTVPVSWLRGDKVMSATLAVPDGWRKTNLGWRMSVSQGNVGAGPDFFPLAFKPDRRKALGIPDGKMAVEPYVGNRKGNLQKAGVPKSAAVVAVDGERPDLAGRPFLVWFRLHHDPGDEVTVTVSEAKGQERDVKYRVGRDE